jgi:ketosteroid isomerase-like protein
MRRILIALSLLTACAVGGMPQKSGAPQVDVAAERRALAQNEREFARMAAAKGMRTAFLAFIADDAILFRPTPTNGKKWWTERADASGLLSWEPVYADVSRAGDLGYTLGPWEYRPKGPEDKPVAYGYYMSIWRKQADGSWKFVMDQGTPTPAPSGPKPNLSFPEDSGRKSARGKPDANVAEVQTELLKQERFFSQSSLKDTLAAHLSYAADDIRFMRPGHFPVTGREAMRVALAAAPGTLSWEPTFAAAARSGELGYTYGDYEFKSVPQGDKPSAVEKGNYIRIWKKKDNGNWRVVVDVLAPHRAQP